MPYMTYSSLVLRHTGMSHVTNTKESCHASYAMKVQRTYRNAKYSTNDIFLFCLTTYRDESGLGDT